MEFEITIDVETSSEKPLDLFLNLLDKYNYKAIFFVPARLLEKLPEKFLEIKKRGHKIGLHGYEHERFDSLDKKEKEKRIIKGIKIYKKILKTNPKYFRAPQFSADFELLELLEKHNFKEDYSVVSCPITQVIFFPSKIPLFFKQLKFKKLIKQKNMKIKENPLSSFILPVSMFSFKILPFFIFNCIIKLSLMFSKNKKIIFLIHSYELNQKSIKKLRKLLNYLEHRK